MAEAPVLNNLVNLTNGTTAVNTINANNAAITTAFEDVLSLSGTAPNQMQSTLDMNNNQILNLPAPATANSPARLQDLSTVTGGGTLVITPLPTGGIAGQLLTKNSSTNYDASWQTQVNATYNTQALAAAATIASTVYGIQTLSYAALGDNGGCVYTRTSGTTLGGFQSADGGWWTPSGTPNPFVYGVKGDGVTNDGTALQNYITAMSNLKLPCRFPGFSYNLGSSCLSTPAGMSTYCDTGCTFIRSSEPSTGYGGYTQAMVSLGSQNYWKGGTFNNTAVPYTSTTTQTYSTGTKTFAGTAGVSYWVGGYSVEIVSSSNPANWMQGVITSYNNATGALVVSVNFVNGTGSGSSWNINTASVYNCAIVLHNCTQTIVEGAIANGGSLYCGFVLDGYSQPAGPYYNTSYCTLKDCQSVSVQNRGFYYYGTCSDCNIINCTVIGNYITDYGFNYNGVNATGSVNTIQRCHCIGCKAIACAYQGFAPGENSNYCEIVNCTASSINNPNVSNSGVGFLLQAANGISPQYCKISGCIANACVIGFQVVGANYSSIVDCMAVTSTLQGFVVNSTASYMINIKDSGAFSNGSSGFEIGSSSSRCSLDNVDSAGNYNGIVIDSGAASTRVSGQTLNSTSTNYINNGTNTIVGSLTTS